VAAVRLEPTEHRLGKFRLMRDANSGRFYICWTAPNGTPGKRSTQTGELEDSADVKGALSQLSDFNREHGPLIFGVAGLPATATSGGPAAPSRLDPLAEVVFRLHWNEYARKTSSAHAFARAELAAGIIWKGLRCSQLNKAAQVDFVKRLREGITDEFEPLKDSTISGYLNRLWAAFERAMSDGINPDGSTRPPILTRAPVMIAASDWPDGRQITVGNHDIALSNAQIAQLLNVVPAIRDATPSEREHRYASEHWWRFSFLLLITGSRPDAIRALRWDQIEIDADGARGLIYLNPEGRQQTHKRRAVVPIGPLACREINSWPRTSAYVLDFYGEPLATLEFFDTHRQRAGLCTETENPDGTISRDYVLSAKTFRHTLISRFARARVDAKEFNVYVGHADAETLGGSRTAKHYVHLDPRYCENCVAVVERMLAELQPLLIRSLGGWVWDDQPELAATAGLFTSSFLAARDYRVGKFLNLERERGLEPPTPTLARSGYPEETIT
jgi:integrase